MRMRLEAGGFEAFVQDENMVQVDLLCANALGGVRVQVADEDLQSVHELLASDPGFPADSEAIRCPNCGATTVEYERFSKRFAYLSLFLLHIPLLLFRKRYRCDSCLHTWKP